MAEVFLVNDGMITHGALMSLAGQVPFVRSVKASDDVKVHFAMPGMKNGSTMRIRKPPLYEVTQGQVYVGQSNQEREVSLTLHQEHVGLNPFTNQDRTLRIDNFRKRFLNPATLPLGVSADLQGLATAKSVWNIVGTHGTAPTALLTYGQALVRLTNEGAPLDELQMAVSPQDQIQIVDAVKGLFHSGDELEEAYKRARMGYASGFSWFMDSYVHRHTTGHHTTNSTPLAAETVAEGATSIATDGWELNAGSNPAVLLEGDHFHFAGVNAVVAQSRDDATYVREFVVTQDVFADAAGLATINFQPAMWSTTAQKTITALPADGAAVIPFGPEDTVGTYNIGFHPQAFQYAFVPLDLPPELVVKSYAMDENSGISLTYQAGFDIKTQESINRFDLLFGVICQYPELACIVAGGALTP